jgi:hypothetical protein
VEKSKTVCDSGAPACARSDWAKPQMKKEDESTCHTRGSGRGRVVMIIALGVCWNRTAGHIDTRALDRY